MRGGDEHSGGGVSSHCDRRTSHYSTILRVSYHLPSPVLARSESLGIHHSGTTRISHCSDIGPIQAPHSHTAQTLDGDL